MMKAAEASGQTPEERRAERRQKAVVGPLPESFLRIPVVAPKKVTIIGAGPVNKIQREISM